MGASAHELSRAFAPWLRIGVRFRMGFSARGHIYFDNLDSRVAQRCRDCTAGRGHLDPHVAMCYFHLDCREHNRDAKTKKGSA
jgi:hypothetical protein